MDLFIIYQIKENFGPIYQRSYWYVCLGLYLYSIPEKIPKHAIKKSWLKIVCQPNSFPLDISFGNEYLNVYHCVIKLYTFACICFDLWYINMILDFFKTHNISCIHNARSYKTSPTAKCRHAFVNNKQFQFFESAYAMCGGLKASMNF